MRTAANLKSRPRRRILGACLLSLLTMGFGAALSNAAVSNAAVSNAAVSNAAVSSTKASATDAWVWAAQHPVDAYLPEFSTNDHRGKKQSLTGLLGKKGTLLFFNRSADW